MPPVFLLVFILVLQNSVQIIVPGENDNQKPLTNSPGIKTTILQVHHNYSKVSHQGSYQIHNAHTYGAKPQVFVVNKSVVAENKDPDKPILIQKKRRQTSKIEVYHKCPTGSTGQFVYDLSCNQFLNCWKGRGFVQNCAPGTLFNPKTLECDFAQKVECITGPRHNSFERSQKIVEQVGCPKDFSGIIPDYFDCSKFINCANGVENNMDCPPGTLFDVTKNICDFAHKASCFNGQNEKLVAAGGSESVGVNSKLDFYGSGCKFGQSGQCRGSGSGTGNSYGQESTSYEQTQGHFGSGSYSSVTPCKNCKQGNKNTYGQGSVSYGGSQDQHSSSGNYNGGNRDFQTPCQNCRTSENSGNGPHGQQTTYAGSQDQHSYSSGSNLGSNYDYSQSHKGSLIPCQNCQHAHGGTNVEQTAYDQQSHNFGQSSGQALGHRHQGQSQIENSGTNFGQSSGQAFGQSSGQAFGHQHQGQSQIENSGTNFGQSSGQAFGHQHQEQSQMENSGTNFGQSSNRGGYYQTHYGHATTNGREGTFGQSQIDNSGTDFGQTLNHGQGGNYPPQYGHSSTSSRDEARGHQYQKQGADFEQNSNHRSQFGQASSQQSAGHFSHQKVECPHGVAGIQRHPTDCSKFLNCANGQTFIQDCAPGTLFNPDNSICDFPYKVKCEIGGSTSSQHSEGYDRNENRNYGNSDYSGRDQDNQENYEGSTAQQSNCNKKNNFCRTENTASASNIQENVVIEQTTIPNYQQVININQHVSATPKTPLRKPYEPFFGTTGRPRFNQQVDYEDVYNSAQSSKYTATTPRIEAKSWPPPFPSTDVNADYVFEYVDGDEITLEAENNLGYSKTTKKCQKGDFHCSPETCIPKTLVCNSRKDCPNGVDEVGCEDYVQQFSVEKNHKLAILEKQRWDNVTVRTCALLCLENQKFRCKSFNYRKIDKTCFLTNTNIAYTGALISYYPCDYYERISETIDCSSKFMCPNSKCIEKHQLCDGHDDCGDRTDEKNCNSENFGYGVKLTGTPNSHEGQIEVTAFGKTGFICDDKFGLRDADVVCRELGFTLGAIEVKTNSFYSRNGNINNTFYMMDDVTCVGNETKLMDCDFNGWGIHNCLSQEIVGVVCKTPQEKCSRDYWQCDTGQECLPVAFVCDGLLDCTDNSDEEKHHCDAPTEVRLVNGTNPRQGRIEIKHNGIWGSICDDDFNEDAGKVVCKQLGFKGSSVVKKDGYFGAGGGPIWLDQVSCTGNETSIEECTHWNWGEHNCEHSEDVGVICSHIETHERHSTHVEPERNRLDFHPQKCGLRNDNIFGINDEVHFRVVSGSLATKGEYPWQAALRVKGRTKPTHWCGAVVISEKFVLTAAHCLMGYSKGAYVVVAGDYNVDEDEGTEQTAFIDDYFIHENFRKDRKMNNDIALIRLKGHGFTLSGEVQALCLPDEGINYEKDLNCTISGFGSIESGKSGFSHNLRAGWIPLQKRNICSMPHVYGDALTEGMICAGSLDEGVDSCDGDSGGPLACLNNGLFTLYGITSWGQHCGYANKPGVYVKVAHYRKWIDDTMQKHWVAEN